VREIVSSATFFASKILLTVRISAVCKFLGVDL